VRRLVFRFGVLALDRLLTLEKQEPCRGTAAAEQDQRKDDEQHQFLAAHALFADWWCCFLGDCFFGHQRPLFHAYADGRSRPFPSLQSRPRMVNSP
jgi:hypothetical protein